MRTFAIAFTGHRPDKLPTDEALLLDLESMLWDKLDACCANGCDTCYCGMAMGADIFFGEVVIRYNIARNAPLRLICVPPYTGHEKHFPENWQQRSRSLLSAGQRIDLAPGYFSGCYHQRNRYLVDHADILIVLYNGTADGGTAYTVDYARKRGRKIIVIHPDTLARTHI